MFGSNCAGRQRLARGLGRELDAVAVHAQLAAAVGQREHEGPDAGQVLDAAAGEGVGRLFFSLLSARRPARAASVGRPARRRWRRHRRGDRRRHGRRGAGQGLAGRFGSEAADGRRGLRGRRRGGGGATVADAAAGGAFGAAAGGGAAVDGAAQTAASFAAQSTRTTRGASHSIVPARVSRRQLRTVGEGHVDRVAARLSPWRL